MFPPKIHLSNRYGDKNYLELITERVTVQADGIAIYKLTLEEELPIRMGVEDNKFWVDPSGGPFIRAGFTIGDLEVIGVYVSKENICIEIMLVDNLDEV